MKKSGFFTMLIVLTMIILGACSGSRPADQPDLDGTSWALTAIDEAPPIEATRPTLQLEGGQVSGNASCNSFGGTYQLDEDTIEFSDLYNTEMFCMEPEGAMEQEQLYLDLLRSARRFELGDDRLTIYTEQDQTLRFQNKESIAEPSPTPDLAELTSEPTTAPTLVPTFQPPTGFKEYRDVVTGISIFIPESWNVTGVVDGEYAILQSYPEDKYIGGEAREPGDAKCDLNIRPPGETETDILQAWEADDRTTILSESEISLLSGEPATRFELDSMGRANVVLTRLDARVCLLTCFGDFTLFDQIAGSLRAGD